MIPLSGHGSLALRDLAKGKFTNASAWVGESSKSQCLIPVEDDGMCAVTWDRLQATAVQIYLQI